jgi:hypothetical protein
VSVCLVGTRFALSLYMNTTIQGLNEQETRLARLMFAIAVRDSDGAERIRYITDSFLEAWENSQASEHKMLHSTLVH